MKQHILWFAAIATTGLIACGQDKALDPPKPSDTGQEPGSTASEPQESEPDSATERWRASWALYNDDATYLPARRGHAFSRRYMQFLNAAAAQERARHGSKIPAITRTSASGS